MKKEDSKMTNVNEMNIYQRLVKAQSEMPSITKDAKGYGYNYAKLDQIYEKVLPILNSNGLFHYARIDCNHPELVEVIIVCADTGETISTYESLMGIHEDVTLNKDGKPSMTVMQRYGSAKTYAIRYGILSLLGICPENDNDGATTSAYNAKPSYQRNDMKPLDHKKGSDELISAQPSANPLKEVESFIKEIEKVWEDRKEKAYEKDTARASRIMGYINDSFHNASKDNVVAAHKWLMELQA